MLTTLLDFRFDYALNWIYIEGVFQLPKLEVQRLVTPTITTGAQASLLARWLGLLQRFHLSVPSASFAAEASKMLAAPVKKAARRLLWVDS